MNQKPRQSFPFLEGIAMNLKKKGLPPAVDALSHLPSKLVGSAVRNRMGKGVRFTEGVDFMARSLEVLVEHWGELAPNVRKRFVQNIFGFFWAHGSQKREQANALFDGEYPICMVISPTMRCNFKCQGCYSFNYERRDAISTDRFHELLNECKELGINFVVVSGGEPYMRGDLIEMFEEHSSMYFLTYTNGSIIADQKLAPKLAELGNVLPCISVEGFRTETESRRGRGVFEKIERAMLELKDAGVLFGFSATPTRYNNELLLNDKFVEHYKKLGALVGWYFSYMPIGHNPDLDLMPTAAQRLHRFHRIRALREKHNLIIADFWCDGMLTGGCLSAGRTYFHVNAQGGVEPCVFNQFHVDNILDKSLEDCLRSPYMRDVRLSLNDVENPLRPCPVCDNPWMQRRFVREHHAVPSQKGADDVLKEDIAAGLDRYSQELKEVFDPVFAQLREGYPWPLHLDRAPNPANDPPGESIQADLSSKSAS